MDTRTGTVVALCISPKGGVPKYPQEEVIVSWGFPGDFHSGPTRISRRTRQLVFNDRQLSIVAQELYDQLGVELGVTLKAGDFAENITTKGLGDLSDLAEGDLLIIDGVDGVVLLRVTEQNIPCDNLLKYHELMMEKSYGKRGVLAVVHAGAGVYLRPGARIHVVKAEDAPAQLQEGFAELLDRYRE
ncbi:MAG: sulfurase [Candidatus Sungbacteria bacterium]|nr:sulfurase [Candidatus Sungbacteria bacterium]